MAGRGLLRTRLLAPRLPTGCVMRPRLVDAVLGGLEGRLVAVVAGAGYGKTTLLAQALAADRRAWAWVSCDRGLAHPGTLLAHLAAAITQVFPGFDARLDLSAGVDEQLAELCNEMVETVAEDFVLAID